MARYGWTTGNYLSVAATPLTATPVTISCWFYANSLHTGGLVDLHASASANNRNCFQLFTVADGTITARTGSSSASSSAITTDVYTANRWWHVAAVFASATSRYAFLNGVASPQNTTSRVPSGINASYVGALGGSSISSPFDGYLADVAIWNVDLTAQEVLALSRNVPPSRVRAANLVCFWPLSGEQRFEKNALADTYDLAVTGTLARVEHPGWLRQPAPKRRILAAPSADVNQALTGVSSTTAVGTVTPSTTVAIGGEAATGSVGTLTPQMSVALSGNAATGAVGTVGVDVQVALTGVSATGQVGDVGVAGDKTVALTGVQSAAAVGSVGPGTSVALTGLAASASIGDVAPSSTLGIGGIETSASVGTLVPALSVAIAGIGATASIGDVAPSLTLEISGVSLIGAVGDLTPVTSGDVTVALTGVNATGEVGNVTASGGDVSPQQLAELYGGNIFSRRKKKEEDEEPTLREKIELIGQWVDDGKEQIVKTLPREQRRKIVEPALVPIEELARQVMQASKMVHEKIEALYEEVLDEENAVALSLLFDMQTDTKRLKRRRQAEEREE